MQKSATKYANDMSNLTCSTAENILKIGSLMIDAKSKLNESEYQEFLELTAYDKKSSAVRKWNRIGESYVRLMPIANKLPPHWSTIYAIAKLDSNKFDLLEKSNILNQSVTLREISETLNLLTKKSKIQINFVFSSLVTSFNLLKMFEAMKDSIDLTLCEFKLSEEAQILLDEAESKLTTLKLVA
jgi:hypothetical protein